ncbi:uncharacterized protein LOC130817301 [Amaranthus tricolor]|uniref:uncharacterized protein LOC130817301 n=1 Tax=Amaranthus tricolor TaxID=29722 RepID=UPI0025900B9D|nr:uncharacterized protein LOC130817301 [Amaranthus tricolor]
MECNKEEALRAKEISLKKMEAKDFVGARKFALKAQQLYPEMENMSQMLCVCDVHCSAETKIVGNESDWYGILQIEQTADEAMIRKQYRKFALLLHPDKNKFFGAEAAFKLIGEAQRVLLDKEKRQFYDLKCRASCKLVRKNQPHQQPSRNFNVAKPSVVPKKFTSNSNSHVDVKAFNATCPGQTQPGGGNGKETFWTQCPFCAVRYQYYKEIQNRLLRCQSCKKPFTAYDMLAHGTRPGAEATQHVFPGQNIPNVNGSKAGSVAKNSYASNAGFQSGKKAKVSQSQKSRQAPKGSNKGDRKAEQGSKPVRKINSQRRKKHSAESRESFGSESSLDSEEVEIPTDSRQQYDSGEDCRSRKSNRNKRNVSYKYDASDEEEIINPSKKAKETGSSCPAKKVDVNASEKRQEPDPSKQESKKVECNKSDMGESTKKNYEADDDYFLASSPEEIPEPEYHEYPDPEFCDFDKFRGEKCFKVGQVWAAYDTFDAMPRFYAKIRKIFPGRFKLRITWLEADPDDTLGIEWANVELPYSNGKFTYGNSENTADRLMFSHEVTWNNGEGKDSVLIYPMKGEIWALFKIWDANWYLTLEKDTKLEFEFVEILSEYDATVGIRVAQLGKLKGFASLFCRKNETEIQIPPTELLKFSHKVPSCRMRGDEREGVPKDSFELDPASLSMNVLEEFSLPRSNKNACSANAKFEGLIPGVVRERVNLSAFTNTGTHL